MKLKKLLVTLIIVLMATSSYAVEAISTGGLGWIFQRGEESKSAIEVGIDIPIYEVKTAGIVIKNQSTMLISEFNDGLDIIKTNVINQKYIHDYKTAKIYFGIGAGLWVMDVFESAEDVAYGSYLFSVGAEYKQVDFSLNFETVEKPGNNLKYIGFGLNLIF